MTKGGGSFPRPVQPVVSCAPESQKPQTEVCATLLPAKYNCLFPDLPAALPFPRTGARKNFMTAEEQRLEESHHRTKHWKRWGPYLADRQWGTVREDYSPDGTAWENFRNGQRVSGADG